MVREQEFAADAFAVEEGHGQGLLSFLMRYPADTPATALHPSPEQRISRIVSLIVLGSSHA
jgi:hypothetical protein